MAHTNWAGNLTYGAARVVTPETVAEAQEIVRATPKIRPLGTRHCFNAIADTDAVQLSLERQRRIVSLDKARRQVVIEGGMRYGDLTPELHAAGFALHNLASLPHISVAGAIATATHGSGVTLRGLGAAVAALEFIDARGDLVTLSRDKDGDTFSGAVVHLGCLGVVTRITLDLEPTFDIRQDIFVDLPVEEGAANFDAIMSAGYSVSWFTDWNGSVIEQVWIKSRVAPGVAFAPRSDVFGAKPASRKMHPVSRIDPIHCTEQLGEVGPGFDKLPHFRMGFTPASGEEIQVEYFVPQEFAVDVVKLLARFGSRLSPLLMISEVRMVAADDFWMSPFRKRPSTAFHFSFHRDWPALSRLLPELEAALAPFHPLPHWGKQFTLSPAVIQSRYPRLADFRALAAKHDPQGKFRNGFVEKNVFGR